MKHPLRVSYSPLDPLPLCLCPLFPIRFLYRFVAISGPPLSLVPDKPSKVRPVKGKHKSIYFE